MLNSPGDSGVQSAASSSSGDDSHVKEYVSDHMIELIAEEDEDDEDMVPDLFCQMNVLRSYRDDLIWKEMARWVKYEEAVEEGGKRWSKPHVSSLAMQALQDLEGILKTCPILLDVECNQMSDIVDQCTNAWSKDRLFGTLKKNHIRSVLLKQHRHQHIRDKDTKKSSSHHHHLPHLRHHKFTLNHLDETAEDSDTDATGDNTLHVPRFTKRAPDSPSLAVCPKSNVRFLRKIPLGAEAANILVGELDELDRRIAAFVRLKEAKNVGDITEVKLNTRFLFILLGPKDDLGSCAEIGRCIASLFTDEVFREVIYKANEREDIVAGIEDFSKFLTVLPPGAWDPSTRIEPPEAIPSQEYRKHVDTLNPSKSMVSMVSLLTSSDSVEETQENAESHADPTLRRTGRLFGGLIADIKRKIPWYAADFKDCLHVQCVASFVFLFLATLTPNVTFGGLLGQATDQYMGTMECILSAAICGIVFALFAGQPLNILGSTGPMLVLEEILYRFCKDQDWDFLPFRVWVGFWTAFQILLVVAFDLSALVRYITRFTEESFACLIALIFIYEAFKKTIEIEKNAPVFFGTRPSDAGCECVIFESPLPNTTTSPYGSAANAIYNDTTTSLYGNLTTSGYTGNMTGFFSNNTTPGVTGNVTTSPLVNATNAIFENITSMTTSLTGNVTSSPLVNVTDAIFENITNTTTSMTSNVTTSPLLNITDTILESVTTSILGNVTTAVSRNVTDDLDIGAQTIVNCTALGGVMMGDACDADSYTPDVFFLSLLLFLATFVLATGLVNFRSSLFFTNTVRHRVSDFAVLIAIVVMVAIDALLGLPTPKLLVPTEFKPTRPDRGWVVNPISDKNPWWLIPLSAVPAVLATILIFMDQQITAVIVNRKENKLKKGSGYHLDMLVVGFLVVVLSVLGLPWYVAATVTAIAHIQSLKKESGCTAPGDKPLFLGVREQRVTALLVGIFSGLAVLITSVLRYIPMPVLYGVFLYMGVAALNGMQFVQRVMILFMPQKYQPDYSFLRHVPLRRVHYFTGIQVFCLAVLWVIKSIKSISIAFPLMVLIICFIRKGLDKLFTQRELKWLDDILPTEHKPDADTVPLEKAGEQIQVSVIEPKRESLAGQKLPPQRSLSNEEKGEEEQRVKVVLRPRYSCPFVCKTDLDNIKIACDVKNLKRKISEVSAVDINRPRNRKISLYTMLSLPTTISDVGEYFGEGEDSPKTEKKTSDNQ